MGNNNSIRLPTHAMNRLQNNGSFVSQDASTKKAVQATPDKGLPIRLLLLRFYAPEWRNKVTRPEIFLRLIPE